MTIRISFFFFVFFQFHQKGKIQFDKLSFRFFCFNSIPRILSPIPQIPNLISYIPTPIPNILTQIPRIPTPISRIPFISLPNYFYR